MKHAGKALLILVVLAFVAFASQTLVSETPTAIPDTREDCVVDEQGDCAARCQTEYNCCIKSCNWVEPKAKTVCIKHCESILNKCNEECAEPPAQD